MTNQSPPNIAHTILKEQPVPVTLPTLLNHVQRQGHLQRARYAGLALRNALLGMHGA